MLSTEACIALGPLSAFLCYCNPVATLSAPVVILKVRIHPSDGLHDM